MVLTPADSLASPIEALGLECSQILQGKLGPREHLGQTVPRFCEANQGFGQRWLLPDDGEAKRVLLSCMAGPRALELE